MRQLVLGLVVAALCACGGKKDDGGGTASPGSGTAAKPGGSAKPDGASKLIGSGDGSSAAPAAVSATCEQACERRKACAVTGGDDVAKCTVDCKALADSFTGEVLGVYTKAPCGELAQAETAFRASMSCKKACAHRAECIPEAKDQKKCLGDCTAIAVVSGDNGLKIVDDYITASCDDAKKAEPGFQMSATCVDGCRHVLGCGVEGTFPGCLGECGQSLQQGKLTVDQLVAIQKQSCDDVKKTVTLTSATAPTPAAGGGGGCEALCKNVASCKLGTYDGCMTDCPTLKPERVGTYASYSCDQLRNPPLPDVGFGCLREGLQDCTAGNMCCRRGTSGGRATLRGEAGMCMYPVFCYHRGF